MKAQKVAEQWHEEYAGTDQYFTIQERLDAVEFEIECQDVRIQTIFEDFEFYAELDPANDLDDTYTVITLFKELGIEVDKNYFASGMWDTEFERALERWNLETFGG